MLKRLFLSLLFIYSCSSEEEEPAPPPPPVKYTLTTAVNPAEGGTITPTSGEYNAGTTVTITASPAAEYVFKDWTGATGTTASTSVVMSSNKSVTANFVKKQYPLTIEIEGEGTVTESVIKQGLATDYNSGTIVELTAVPNDNWEFVEWSGDITSTENPTQITIDGPKTIKVKFNEPIGYVAQNGVTIKANSWAKAGDSGEINGETYTVVDREMLSQMISEEKDISKVITTLITDMSYMFRFSKFNGDISSWDVSNVTNMEYLFDFSEFNGDISNWDVSNVTNMSYLFNASKFNGDISSWDVSNVVNMSAMFSCFQRVSQNPFNGDISNWDVSKVTNMFGIFYRSAFNGDISSWDVSNVTDLAYSLEESEFTGNISSWDVSKATTMRRMFSGSKFNGDISNWDVSNVKDMSSMFSFTQEFNQDIGNWDVSSVSMEPSDGVDTGFDSMFFLASSFSQDLSKWCVEKITSTPDSFAHESNYFNEKEKHPKWGESCATIWDGTKITFSKSDGANPNEEANQDRITNNVWITRANDGGQIYNIAKENSSNKTNSPIGTKWAIGSLDEIDNLTFDKFRATVGNPKDVVGKKLVMFLEEDNIYLSVIFTSWSEGKKGGFTYERSTK